MKQAERYQTTYHVLDSIKKLEKMRCHLEVPIVPKGFESHDNDRCL